MIDLNKLQNELEPKGKDPKFNFPFTTNILAEDKAVLQITLNDIDGVIMFLSASEQEISCISHVFLEEEVKKQHIDELNNTLLNINLIMPHCAFTKLDNQYLIKGSLPLDSSTNNIAKLIQNIAFALIENLDLIQEVLIEATPDSITN